MRGVAGAEGQLSPAPPSVCHPAGAGSAGRVQRGHSHPEGSLEAGAFKQGRLEVCAAPAPPELGISCVLLLYCLCPYKPQRCPWEAETPWSCPQLRGGRLGTAPRAWGVMHHVECGWAVLQPYLHVVRFPVDLWSCR